MNTDRFIFYLFVAVSATMLVGYEVITAIQKRGNTISEISWSFPLWLRIALLIATVGFALHLTLAGGILRFITERFSK